MIEVQLPAETRIFLLSRPVQPLIQWVFETLSSGVKWLDCEAKLTKYGALYPLPTYAFRQKDDCFIRDYLGMGQTFSQTAK